MGCAPMSFVLFTEFLRADPKAPKWANRDRFVLSAGHGSMLQYSLLHLMGYNMGVRRGGAGGRAGRWPQAGAGSSTSTSAAQACRGGLPCTLSAGPALLSEGAGGGGSAARAQALATVVHAVPPGPPPPFRLRT